MSYSQIQYKSIMTMHGGSTSNRTAGRIVRPGTKRVERTPPVGASSCQIQSRQAERARRKKRAEIGIVLDIGFISVN